MARKIETNDKKLIFLNCLWIITVTMSGKSNKLQMWAQ